MFSYLLIYDEQMANRESMSSLLTAMPEVIQWRYDLPNSFFVYSNNSANELTTALANRVPNYKCFLFVEISSNRQGYLKKPTWNFINQSAN